MYIDVAHVSSNDDIGNTRTCKGSVNRLKKHHVKCTYTDNGKMKKTEGGARCGWLGGWLVYTDVAHVSSNNDIGSIRTCNGFKVKTLKEP